MSRKEKIVIELSGPSACGKTTAAAGLETVLNNLGYKAKFVAESPRKLTVDFKRAIGDETYAKLIQAAMLCRQVLDIRRTYDKYDIIICDRSLHDFGLYTRIYLPKCDNFCSDLDSAIAGYYKYFDDNVYIYKFNPLSFVSDGVRNPLIYEQEVERFKYLESHNIVKVEEMDTKRRLDYILSDLKQHGRI